MSATKAIEWLETRMEEGMWFRRGLAVATLVLTFQLTSWAAKYANMALESKADLVGTAAVIGAVTGVPLALLTLLFQKYVETR